MHGLLRYYPSYYNVCFKSELICAINIILQTVKTVDVTVGVLVIRFWHAKKPDSKMSFIEPRHCAAPETFSKCTPIICRCFTTAAGRVIVFFFLCVSRVSVFISTYNRVQHNKCRIEKIKIKEETQCFWGIRGKRKPSFY